MLKRKQNTLNRKLFLHVLQIMSPYSWMRYRRSKPSFVWYQNGNVRSIVTFQFITATKLCDFF